MATLRKHNFANSFYSPGWAALLGRELEDWEDLPQWAQAKPSRDWRHAHLCAWLAEFLSRGTKRAQTVLSMETMLEEVFGAAFDLYSAWRGRTVEEDVLRPLVQGTEHLVPPTAIPFKFRWAQLAWNRRQPTREVAWFSGLGIIYLFGVE